MAAMERENELTTFSQALADFREYLTRVELECPHIAADLQSGDVTKSLETIVQIIESVTYLYELMQAAQNILSVRLQDIQITEERSADELLNDLNTLCREMYEAAEAKDYTLLGDLVEYDLVDKVGCSQRMLTIFAQKL